MELIFLNVFREFTYKKLIQLLCLNQIAEALPSSSTITPIVKVVVSIHSVKNIISTSKGLTLSALPLTALAENLFEAFEDLRELRLSNKLTSLTHRHFMSLSSLRTLIIEHFDSDQEHTRQHSLETPRLSLGDKVFETLVNLETLRIVGCGLVTIAENLFEGPRNLQTLYLCSNKIGPSLPLKQFNSLKQLESLCLHDNQIEKLEFEAFTGLPHLRRLGLRNNEISPVDALDLLVKNKISTHKLMTDQCNRWCL